MLYVPYRLLSRFDGGKGLDKQYPGGPTRRNFNLPLRICRLRYREGPEREPLNVCGYDYRVDDLDRAQSLPPSEDERRGEDLKGKGGVP